jgi:hypothetical protein
MINFIVCYNRTVCHFFLESLEFSYKFPNDHTKEKVQIYLPFKHQDKIIFLKGVADERRSQGSELFPGLIRAPPRKSAAISKFILLRCGLPSANLT